MDEKLGARAALLLLAVSALVVPARRAETQTAPLRLVIGLYTPTVQWTSQERAAYLQSLARAIQANVGIDVEGLSFTSFRQLRRQKPDFAIIEGQCVATTNWQVLASSEVGGGPSRRWALYSSQGPSMRALQDQRLSYIRTGCGDKEFIENAMFDSELDLGFFSGRVSKSDLGGAIAEVVSRKGAEAVFAPVGAARGLTQVVETGAVPNPAFVLLNRTLEAELVRKVARTVANYGGHGAISSWRLANNTPYRALRMRMRKRVKRGLFAAPPEVRVDLRAALIEPATVDEVELTGIRHHFEKPTERRE